MSHFDTEKAFELYQLENSITDAARKHCEILNIPYEEKYRHRLSRYINSIDTVGEGGEVPPVVTSSAPVLAGYSALDSEGNLMSPQAVCEKYGLPYKSLKDASLVAHTSRCVYNFKFSFDAEEQDLSGFQESLVDSVLNIESRPKSKRFLDHTSKESKDNSYLLVIDPADCHIGKLGTKFSTGEEYNSEIAIKRVMDGVDGILDKCKGFDIDQIVLIGGNDILHSDSPGSKTTKGTYVDSCEMWYTSFIKAKNLYIDIINKLKEKTNLHFVFNPSNHDLQMGTLLCQVIAAYFKDCENITFDIDLRHRKYYTYHNNLIGFTHGDKAKMNDLGALMAEESPDWSNCKNRYIMTHHVHHKVSKDYIGVTIESVRSPSGSDYWHDSSGYKGVPKAVEAFLHDKQHGQFCRLTHRF